VALRHEPLGRDGVDGVAEARRQREQQAQGVDRGSRRPSRVSSARPTTLMPVAVSQAREGCSRSSHHDSRPTKTGPLPMVTSVPRATPARETPAKKHTW
jgi:hypothetical protein